VDTTDSPEGIIELTMTNTNVYDVDGIRNGADALGEFTIDHCNIFVTGEQFLGFTEFITATNILNVDPLYVDPQNQDFTLQDGSPVADAGIDGTYIGAVGLDTPIHGWMVY
jgi:hypothetical protein